MRKKIVAGNWKMNLNDKEAEALVKEVSAFVKNESPEAEVVVCPPFLYLKEAKQWSSGSDVKIGAQNCSQYKSGAFTGEVSAAMLSSINTDYVIIGHSERRDHFREDSDDLVGKIKQALANNLRVIFCCGEPLKERKRGNHINYITAQLLEVFDRMESGDLDHIVVAYEPIWAIGTGETATPEQAQEMHEMIREVISDQFEESWAEGTTILYGGSVKPGNAAELFAQPDIDGGLVGGASLKADGFAEIVKANR